MPVDTLPSRLATATIVASRALRADGTARFALSECAYART